jgi:CRP/FNR family transcriptional regulator, cyclic AMP receptor protein
MTEPSSSIQQSIAYHRDAIWNVRDLRLFETLTPRQLRKLKPLFEVGHYRQGEVLFQTGDKANLLYFVEKGAIKVSLISAEGDERILDIFKPGDTFGELFASQGHQRTATAQALSTVIVRTLTEDAFKRLMQIVPDVCHDFVRCLVEDQRHTLVRLEAVMHMGSGPRLLTFLLELAERCGRRTNGYSTLVPGRITQQELARMVGLNRTTITLLINRFRRRGVLGGRRNILLIHPTRARAFLRKAAHTRLT